MADERDVHEHEEEARRRRTDAESDRAEAERETERSGDEQGVIPEDADEERRSVVPPRSD